MTDVYDIKARADDLAHAERQAARLHGWRSVLERTNRIISGQPVTVRIAHPLPGMESVSGWSDGQSIYFNRDLLVEMFRTAVTPDAIVESVLKLKGLNYHELSHVLFTPRATDELPKRIKERSKKESDTTWWYSFNALEDQRIESMFTAAYGPSRRYFEAMMLQWVIKEGTAECAILVYGRKYLPARIRVQAGKVFVKKYNEDLYAKFKQVIDEYSKIDLPRDSMKAIQLVARYHELLKEMQNIAFSQLPQLPVEDNGIETHSGHSTPTVQTGQIDKAAAREAAEKAAQQAEEAEAEAEELEAGGFDDPDVEGDEADGDVDTDTGVRGKGNGDKPAKAEASGSEGGDGDGEGGDDGDEESDDDGDGFGGEALGDGGGGAGETGTVEHSVLTEDELDLEEQMRALMEEAQRGVEDIMDDDYVREDAEAVLDSVNAQIDKALQKAEGVEARINQTLTPMSDTQLAVRQITQILTRVKQEAEPTIHHRQLHGRLDMRRVLNHQPNEFDLFRAYDNGSEEETGIEAVIAMDVSGSMHSLAVDASKAVWVLKRAFDRLDIRSTVLVYDTEHYVLYQPGDKAPNRIQVVSTGGGTNPISFLTEAHNLFSRSQRANLLLVSVTDGAWTGDPDQIEALMRSMHRKGVISMLLGLGGAVERYGSRGHLLKHDLHSVRQLPKAVTAIVEAIIRNHSNSFV